jgi:ATP-dependent RNA helicase RhlE
MFSATLSKEIEALTHEFQNKPKMVQIGRRSNPAETVTQLIYEVPAALKPALLIHLLRDPSFDSVLVFTRTKHGADRIAKRLGGAQVTTATLHSNRSQNQRLNALKAFKSGEVRVLVATDIAARGIDVDGISHVVNFDFPMHPEDYIHRIGRTGRALAIGDAISFVTPDDRDALRSVERFIGRGVVRKRADDFNYNALPPVSPERRENRPFPQRQSASPGNRSARPQPGDTRRNRPPGGRRFGGR